MVGLHVMAYSVCGNVASLGIFDLIQMLMVVVFDRSMRGSGVFMHGASYRLLRFGWQNWLQLKGLSRVWVLVMSLDFGESCGMAQAKSCFIGIRPFVFFFSFFLLFSSSLVVLNL